MKKHRFPDWGGDMPPRMMAGNRTARNDGVATTSYALGADDRIASWAGSSGGAYAYDTAGCVTRIERDGRPTLDLAWNGQYQPSGWECVKGLIGQRIYTP